MKKLIIVVALILLLLIPIACAKAPEPPQIVPAPMPSGRGGDFAPEGLPSIVDRMIVRTGEMALVVEDVISARDKIGQIAVRYGGYVVSSRISGEEQETRGYISIRVPDQEFESTLAELRSLAVRVTSENTSSQDVTEEYVDLQARLKNAEAMESQYLALLEKAQDVEDILRIYERLSQVRNEIEQIKGRTQYLERITSMSLVSVSLEPQATAKPLVRTSWNIIETFKSAVRGLAIAGQIIGTIAVWLLIFSPIWGAILGIIYWRLRRRKKASA